MLKVYLAGPEVFLPGGRELIERKRALSTRYGFTPSPLHADLTPTASASPLARGIEISRLNEERMREADVCIANLTPFRGVSADPGTVYELGYMAAEGKPVFAYTNDDPALAKEEFMQFLRAFPQTDRLSRASLPP